MRITVDQTFDSDHRVVNQLGQSSGKFTFTSAESGEHKLCFTPSSASHGGWLSQGQPLGGLKLAVDLAIGETSKIESADKGKIQDIVGKVKELNGRLQDIRREQVFQRVSRLNGLFLSSGPNRAMMSDFVVILQEREAEFRDQSESTNARVVRWTLVQLVVLGVTCAWQLSHLRAFFIKQKLT